MEKIAGIGKYRKIFGVGPLALSISLLLLGFLLLADGQFGPVPILEKPRPFRILGVVFIGVWVCWHAWAIKTIREWWIRDRLCTSGPFRFVRHPMYAGGIFLADIGIILLLNSWIVLLWPVLVYPVWSFLVRKEEKLMESVFGESYTSYAARTGRFVPRLWKKSV